MKNEIMCYTDSEDSIGSSTGRSPCSAVEQRPYATEERSCSPPLDVAPSQRNQTFNEVCSSCLGTPLPKDLIPDSMNGIGEPVSCNLSLSLDENVNGDTVVVSYDSVKRHLLVAYRWMTHFLLGLNQLSCSEGHNPISFVHIRVEDLPWNSDGDKIAGNDHSCLDSSKCRIQHAIALVTGITEVYSELSYRKLVENHKAAVNQTTRISLPSSMSQGGNGAGVCSEVLTPGFEEMVADLVPIMLIPTVSLFDSLVHHIRVLETAIATQHDSSGFELTPPVMNGGGSEVSLCDEAIPSQPLLDPRMPWNGSVWLPSDTTGPSTLPVLYRTQLDEFNRVVETIPSEQVIPRHKMVVACTKHQFFLVAFELTPQFPVNGFILRKLEETSRLKWLLAEKENELDLECDESERLRCRLVNRNREVDLWRERRREEMRRRMSLRTENFDLKRLVNKYEDVLADLRGLVFKQALKQSAIMSGFANGVNTAFGDDANNTGKYPHLPPDFEDIVEDWTGFSEEVEGEYYPPAALRMIGEFDSVVDHAAETIDRYRTAYLVDGVNQYSATHGYSEEVDDISNDGDDRYYEGDPTLNEDPVSLPFIEDVAPHFGATYPKITGSAIVNESMNSTKAGTADEVNYTLELPEDSCATVNSVDDAKAGRDTSGAAIVSVLLRRLRRYELILKGSESQIDHHKSRVETAQVLDAARCLSMTSWCIIKHVIERLIDLIAAENERNRESVRYRISRASKKLFRSVPINEYDALVEKEKLLFSVNRVINRLYSMDGHSTASRGDVLLSPLYFPKKRSHCTNVDEIILEIWDVLGFLAGAQEMAPLPLKLPSAITHPGFVSSVTSHEQLRSYWPEPYQRSIEDAAFQDTGVESDPNDVAVKLSSSKNNSWLTTKGPDGGSTPETCHQTPPSKRSNEIPILRRLPNVGIGGKMRDRFHHTTSCPV